MGMVYSVEAESNTGLTTRPRRILCKKKERKKKDKLYTLPR